MHIGVRNETHCQSENLLHPLCQISRETFTPHHPGPPLDTEGCWQLGSAELQHLSIFHLHPRGTKFSGMGSVCGRGTSILTPCFSERCDRHLASTQHGIKEVLRVTKPQNVLDEVKTPFVVGPWGKGGGGLEGFTATLEPAHIRSQSPTLCP